MGRSGGSGPPMVQEGRKSKRSSGRNLQGILVTEVPRGDPGDPGTSRSWVQGLPPQTVRGKTRHVPRVLRPSNQGLSTRILVPDPRPSVVISFRRDERNYPLHHGRGPVNQSRILPTRSGAPDSTRVLVYTATHGTRSTTEETPLSSTEVPTTLLPPPQGNHAHDYSDLVLYHPCVLYGRVQTPNYLVKSLQTDLCSSHRCRVRGGTCPVTAPSKKDATQGRPDTGVSPAGGHLWSRVRREPSSHVSSVCSVGPLVYATPPEREEKGPPKLVLL